MTKASAGLPSNEEKQVIKERLTAVMEGLELSARTAREHAWMAQYSTIRADALATFVRFGGTRNQFEFWWPDAFEEGLEFVRILNSRSEP